MSKGSYSPLNKHGKLVTTISQSIKQINFYWAQIALFVLIQDFAQNLLTIK